MKQIRSGVIGGIMQVDVVRAVRSAFERSGAGGVKAAASFGEIRGGVSAGCRELSIIEANEVIAAVVGLEGRFNLALMARVNDGSMAFLAKVFDELVAFVAHHGGEDVLRFGRAGLQYWVRHWLAGMGSFREFGREFGVHHETAGDFYRGRIECLLQGWLIAACGLLEPVIVRLQGCVLEAA